jgi:hypothetical protein
MTTRHGNDIRPQVLEFLLERVGQDRYPSITMLDMIERLVEDDDVDAYADVLLNKVSSETHPSMDMLRRLHSFT